MDQMALFDLPDTINYILKTTCVKSLSYIGFSQGSAMGFSSLSLNHELQKKVNVFIALSPATKPLGLDNKTIHSFVNASPELIYLFFGRKAMLSSVYFWQSVLSVEIFNWGIDQSLWGLFGWRSEFMTSKQVRYRHLYSYTSVKCVVHWFQIMKAEIFQMYDDQNYVIPQSQAPSSVGYKVPAFPTKQIQTPIALFHGGRDTLPDLNYILKNMPTPVCCLKITEYEHLQFLWGIGQDVVLFPAILGLLDHHSENFWDINGDRRIRTVPWISKESIKDLYNRGKMIRRDPITDTIIELGSVVSVMDALGNGSPRASQPLSEDSY
jgi:lysosomal acid lipase/cholesteryl ester hydrolase